MLKEKKNYLVPIIGFALIIIIAAIILVLPGFNNMGLSFKETLFTSVSAITTTGISNGPISSNYTFLGQFIIALEMEIGALGFIVFISYFWYSKNKKIKISDRDVINDGIGYSDDGLLRNHINFIIKFMIVVQIVAVVLVVFAFIPRYGIIKGVWRSIFTTISAFSNCGLDNLGVSSMIPFENNAYIQIVIICLMLIGSIGVIVIEDFINNKIRKFSRLKIITKIILTCTAFLIVVPTIILKIYEPKLTIINCLFTAISARNTGLTVVSIDGLSHGSKVLLTILMFIGGSPTSTAGGVRVVAVALVLSTVWTTIKGREELVLFNKKIKHETVYKAISIIVVAILVLIVSCTLFRISTGEQDLLKIIFENVSAISNTGYSLYDYMNMNYFSECIIMVLMFIGRVGPITVVYAVTKKDKKSMQYDFPTANIIL